ncbi:prepilin peptidase [Pantoea cypripedii]|uniref:Prepilin leader peptidase/N-methyltransferase n=1 Tax=Pantoea cypripedii TaxID=55209 RepID=A0A6B9G3Q5_PANCY|nr:A24 family peptidase [Pantoea cypripedii]QGY32251.1 prepilin peptidase [Pantoea cypripedii]
MLVTFFAILGAVIGSFCNVVIYRLPKILMGEPLSLSWPASHCPHCHQPVRAWQNIPLLSWCLLRGRCAHCQQPISWRYPLVEGLMALLFALVTWRQGITPPAVFDLLVISLLIPLLFIDLQTQLLPDRLTLPLLALALLFAASGEARIDFTMAAVAAALGFGLPWCLSSLFRWWRGYEGMGMGDMKLFAGLGAWLGIEPLFTLFSVSSLLAIISALVLLRVKVSQPFAFGPYPIIAALGWMLIYH